MQPSPLNPPKKCCNFLLYKLFFFFLFFTFSNFLESTQNRIIPGYLSYIYKNHHQSPHLITIHKQIKSGPSIHFQQTPPNQNKIRWPRNHFTSSDTQPTSGVTPAPVSVSNFSDKFSLLSFSNILARRSRPDSTRSIGSSSTTQSLSQTSTHLDLAAVGVDGRLRNSAGATPGDPNCNPHDAGIDFALLSCIWRREARTWLTELTCIVRRIAGLMGESGGESEGGDTGGVMRVDVGEGIKRADRMGEPSYESSATDEIGDGLGLREAEVGFCWGRMRSCSGVWAKKQTRLRQPVPSLHG